MTKDLVTYLLPIAVAVLPACSDKSTPSDPNDPLGRTIELGTPTDVDFLQGDADDDENVIVGLHANADESSLWMTLAGGGIYRFDLTGESPTREETLSLGLAGNGHETVVKSILKGDRLIAITHGGAYLVDVTDPSTPTVTANFLAPALVNAGASSGSANIIRGGCMLGDDRLALARSEHSSVAIDSLFLGLYFDGGLSVFDLSALSGDAGILTPVHHLATSWLSAMDCAMTDDGMVFVADNDDGGYFPFWGEILIGLGVTEYLQILLGGMGAELQAAAAESRAPDLSAFVWPTTQAAASDEEKRLHEQTALNAYQVLMSTIRQANLTNTYTADVLAPRDPPGPWALDYGVGTATPNRGDGPVYVNLAADPDTVLGLVGSMISALDTGDAATVLGILLGSDPGTGLLPHYCWEANPYDSGNNDFEDPAKTCLLLIPRFGVAGMVYAIAFTEQGTSVDLTTELENALYKPLLVAGGMDPADVATPATILTRYNSQLWREYVWLHNRAGMGPGGLIHLLDYSDPGSIGAYTSAPTLPQIEPLFDEIRGALQTALAADLAAAKTDTDLTTLVRADLGDNVFPHQYGPHYGYPDGNDVADIYGRQLGKPMKTWGTAGLTLQSPLLGEGHTSLHRVPGQEYIIGSSTEGWDLLARVDGGLQNALHVGPPLPNEVDVGDVGFPLPVRFDQEGTIPTLAGYDTVSAAWAVGLDSRTILLVDANHTGDRGRAVVLDIDSMSAGQEPVQLYNGSLGLGARPTRALLLPSTSTILIAGMMEGPPAKGQIWRLTTDIPYSN